MSSAAIAILDGLAAPLDAARRRAFALVTRSRTLTRLVARKDRRLLALAVAQIAVQLALAIVRPMWLFVYAPLLLGVPHVVSGARHVLYRRDVSRAAHVLAVAGCGAFVLLRLWPRVGGARAEVLAGGLWIVAALLLAPRGRRYAGAVLAALAVLASTVLVLPHAALVRLGFAHVHNVVGVVAWIALFRPRPRHVLPVLALLAGATCLLASGATLGWTLRAGGDTGAGADLFAVGRSLAPWCTGAAAATWATVFVFLQGVHYAAWLVWIPHEELPAQGTFTFRMSGRALLRDVGPGIVALAALLLLLLGARAAQSARGAAETYMTFATFHGYLELAMLAYLAARGARSLPPSWNDGPSATPVSASRSSASAPVTSAATT